MAQDLCENRINDGDTHQKDSMKETKIDALAKPQSDSLRITFRAVLLGYLLLPVNAQWLAMF